MELKIDYERNLNHTYLICRGIQQEADYELQMILNNQIPGMLPCKMEKIDGKADLYYEITSKQPLSRLYEKKKMRFQEFKEMFQSLYYVILKMEEFLLDSDILILKPDMIYVDMEKNKFYFCAIPEYKDDNNMLQELLEFLLDCIDYGDEKAVATAYEWYKKFGEENSSFLSIYSEAFELQDYAEINAQQKSVSISNAPLINNIQNPQSNYVKENDVPDKNETVQDNNIITTSKTNMIHGFIKKNRALIIGMLIMVVIGVSAVLWRIDNVIATKVILIVIVCLLIGGVTYYKKKKKTDTDEMDWDDLLYDENDEEWMCHKDDVQQEKEIKPEEYGETVFFRSEQLKEVKKLKPLTDEFPEFTMELFPFVLGKLKGAVDGVIEHETVSRIHCKIEYEEGDYYITDLNSTNGTVINEDMLNANEKRNLNSGDEVRIGCAIYVFQ